MFAPLLLSIALTGPAGLQGPTEPNLPVFGGGKFVNIFDSDSALTNASAHIGWSIALPLAGKVVGGRKGMWVTGLSWIGLSLATETFFHAPPNPGSAYPSEVRADLLTRILPCAAILAWDLFRSGSVPDMASEPSEPRPRLLLLMPGIDIPRPVPPTRAVALVDESGVAEASPGGEQRSPAEEAKAAAGE